MIIAVKRAYVNTVMLKIRLQWLNKITIYYYFISTYDMDTRSDYLFLIPIIYLIFMNISLYILIVGFFSAFLWGIRYL